MESFTAFIQRYLTHWKEADLSFMNKVISETYQGIEIRDGNVSTHGKQQSLEGWDQAFRYFSEKEMEWILTPLTIIPTKENEVLATIRATMTLDGKLINSSNLFVNTFTNKEGEWKLIRCYEETGIPNI